MLVFETSLKPLVQSIFQASGCSEMEAGRIAHYLVEANLVGHDSHGVIRVPDYVRFLREGRVMANRSLKIVFETDSLAVLDGQYGFGQVIGEQAMRLAAEKAHRTGLVAVALRNTGHLGRIGDWPQLLAETGLVSFHFVNTSGFGLLVAPYGGIDRRLSANPLAAGVPRRDGPPIILDISTSAVAEGKLRVAFSKGVRVPPGCIIDRNGQPTDDPRDFYTQPPGALLPFGGHKGYGLGVIAELFAGALTGNGCTNPRNNQRLLHGMFSIVIDPARLPNELGFAEDVEQFVAFVKSSRLVSPEDRILMPGELEFLTKQQRQRNGIEIEERTWQAILATAQELGVEC